MSKAVVDLFVDREHIRSTFVEMLHGRLDKSIMVLKADGGMGKSWTMAVLRHQCALQTPAVPFVDVNFNHGEAHDYLTLIHTAATALHSAHFDPLHQALRAAPAFQVNVQMAGAAASPVSAHLGDVAGSEVIVAGGNVFQRPTFHFSADSEFARRERERHLTGVFLACLRQLLQIGPAVFFFDTYEKAPQAARTWIETQLLLQIRDGALKQALVVIAGREGPEMDLAWRHCTTRPKLEALNSQDVDTYLRERLGLKDVDTETLFRATRGNPQLLGLLTDNLTTQSDEDDSW
jgi:hypothetical protein